MIKKVGIKNYKSIVDLKLELGRVNIVIGANGSGKSNILEAIALASAANKDRLDDEYLSSRIRLAEPEFMTSEFEGENDNVNDSVIHIIVRDGDTEDYNYLLTYVPDKNGIIDLVDYAHKSYIKNIIDEDLNEPAPEYKIRKLIKDLGGKNDIESLLSLDDLDSVDNSINFIKKHFINKPDISNYLIYCPEELNLRKFIDDTTIRPLGRRGEGLFKHLKELISDSENNREIIEALNSGLSLLDWFEGFEIPNDLFSHEQRLNITDRFLKETSKVFDQRSTNEGFLFLLFYLTLFNSPKTPAFFAIDNIESALNPKLAKILIQHLVVVAKEKGKQVILTTHSPYVIDGLDLSDEEQRLFVVNRNIDGHTEINRVPYRENRTNKLSELWMEGVIGGLPENF